MTFAIRIDNVTKRYRMGRSGSFIDAVETFLGKSSGKERKGEEFWALRGVSLDVLPGEVIGVIGRNGAGKSTLLRILSRITRPTGGSVSLKGRVASLLEVGTGFHPELTGRENVFLSGAILGMSRRETAQKFDSIIDFADVADFVDMPVKHYSSGMYTRLAFAVAAHLDADILLVDEVLAVGDALFQRKCLNKMSEMGKDGRTTLFVSHNLQAISTLTSRCLVLEQGQSLFAGETSMAISSYLSYVESPATVFTAPARSAGPSLTRIEVITDSPNQYQTQGGVLEVHFRIHAPRILEQPSLSFQVINNLGQPVLYLWCFDSETPYPSKITGNIDLVCRIPRVRLYQGRYTLTVNFSENFGRDNPFRVENICPFEIELHGRHHDFGWQPYACSYFEDAEWHFAHHESSSSP